MEIQEIRNIEVGKEYLIIKVSKKGKNKKVEKIKLEKETELCFLISFSDENTFGFNFVNGTWFLKSDFFDKFWVIEELEEKIVSKNNIPYDSSYDGWPTSELPK